MSLTVESTAVIVPWHNLEQRNKWLEAWKIPGDEDGRFVRFGSKTSPNPNLILQQDVHGEGCAKTKNKGIRKAMEQGFTAAVILDDDCYPNNEMALEKLVECHLKSLVSVSQEFRRVTRPPSRGNPHTRSGRYRQMEVAASMGYWSGVGDVDAVTQIVLGHELSNHLEDRLHGGYFPLCGMNLAFHLKWWPWCQFVEVPRFDDIWMGFLWQKRAYATGCCFSLEGPWVHHARQSNVWKNLVAEAPNMEANETLWQRIAEAKTIDYDELRKLLPL